MAYINGNTVRKERERVYYPIHEEKERRSYKTRRNRDKALQMTLPYVMILAAACVAVVAMSVHYLQVRSSINSTMKEIRSLETQITQLGDNNNALEDEINQYIDLNHIYEVATGELGMIPAGEGQVLQYDKTESEYVRQYAEIPK